MSALYECDSSEHHLLKCVFRPVFDLSGVSVNNMSVWEVEKSWAEVTVQPVLSVYFKRNEYCRWYATSQCFHSVRHPARQTQRSRRLGLAHQGHNGAGGGILDLSYSWGTTSMWLLHGDYLLAPNAISPTNHTYVCVWGWACTHAHSHSVQDTKTSQHVLP